MTITSIIQQEITSPSSVIIVILFSEAGSVIIGIIYCPDDVDVAILTVSVQICFKKIIPEIADVISYIFYRSSS